MAPFRYDPYDSSQWTGSIADILRLQGQIPAEAALRTGQIQAEAARQQGQLWGGAVQGIAQNVADTIQQANDPRRKIDALQYKEALSGVAEHDMFKRILKATPPVAENGMQLYDLPTLASKATAAGIDPSAYLEHYANVNNGFRNEYQARLGTVQAGAQGLMLAPDATLAKDFLDRLKQNNTITPQVHAHLTALIEADPSPANITRIATPFAGKQTPIMGKPGDTPLSPITSLPVGPPVPEKPQVVPAGGTLVETPPPGASGASAAPPRVLFTAPAAPSSAGNEAAIRALYAKQASGQPLTPEETAAIKGYETEKSSNDAPVTVKTMENGKAVEKVMTRAQALAAGAFPSQPSASVVIHNMNERVPNMPAWSTDDSRPTGPDRNTLDPIIRMTPNGLFQAAQNYIVNGQFPPTGRGTDPIAVAQRAAITSKVGAIAAASGMDEPALRAFFKSNAASLGQQQKMYDAVQGFMATADKNSVLLEGTLKKIPDIGSSLFNKPLRAFSKEVAGNTDLAQFATYLQSVQNEYGRIISQPNLAGQLTDNARKEAETLVSPSATVPQMIASLQALRNEGTNRLVSVGEQIQRIQQRMQTGGGGSTTPTTPAAAPVRMKAPNGQISTVPANQVDHFKSLGAVVVP